MTKDSVLSTLVSEATALSSLQVQEMGDLAFYMQALSIFI